MLKYLTFDNNDIATTKIALLIKTTAFNQSNLIQHYIQPLANTSIPKKDILALNLDYNDKGKAPVTHVKSILDVILPLCLKNGINTFTWQMVPFLRY